MILGASAGEQLCDLILGPFAVSRRPKWKNRAGVFSEAEAGEYSAVSREPAGSFS